MLGLTTLLYSLEELYSMASPEKKAVIHTAMADLLLWKESNDYLFPFFHQGFEKFDDKELDSVGRGVAWYLIKSKIIQRKCYMIYIETPGMAMPNKYIHELEKWDIEGVKFHVNNSPQGSDGYLELTENLMLKELCVFENDMPKKLKEKQLKKGLLIPLEIGTNDICKMYQYLVPEWNANKTVCRLPYDFNKGNRMGIFYCE